MSRSVHTQARSPEKLNALDTQAFGELDAHLADLAQAARSPTANDSTAVFA
jgi:hypothetical protein